MSRKIGKPTLPLTPDSRLVVQESKALFEKLQDVPTRIHVDYQPFGDSPVYFAVWKENGKTYCSLLGVDQDGRIAARIAEQEQREKVHAERLAQRRENEAKRSTSEEWTPYTCSQHDTYQFSCAECLEVHKDNMRHKRLMQEDDVA